MKKKTKNENISLAVMRNPAKQNKTKQEKMREKKNNAKSEGKDWLND